MRCSLCHKLFAGASAFDAHRQGEWPTHGPVGEAAKARRCLSTEEMRAIGLKLKRGRWCRIVPLLAANQESESA